MPARLLTHYLCLAAALALAMPLARAQATLKVALDAAWQRFPQARTLEARRDETAAGRDAARSWIAGSPSVGLAQRTDRWNNGSGARETEVSLSAPVWLPGQKSARLSQAQLAAEDLEAQIANARLTLAGEVRERIWSLAAAKVTLAEAETHLQHLEAMTDEVMRRVKAGDLARTDGLLAQQEVLAGRAAVLEARTRVQDALSRYSTLTGLIEVPPFDAEPIADALPDPHPRLLAARTGVQHAQASLDVVNKTRSEPPTVGIAMRREKDSAASEPASSVAFAVQVPIGTGARNRPLETAARTQVETASAEAAQAEIQLRAEIGLARSQLTAAQQALEAATGRAVLAREHAQLINKAFRLGERGLAEALRAQTVLHEAEVAERQQRVAVGLAHARLNQALGIIP